MLKAFRSKIFTVLLAGFVLSQGFWHLCLHEDSGTHAAAGIEYAAGRLIHDGAGALSDIHSGCPFCAGIINWFFALPENRLTEAPAYTDWIPAAPESPPVGVPRLRRSRAPPCF